MGPNVPADRVAAISNAMMDTFAEPAFRADAMKQTLEINPVPRESVQSIVAGAYGAPQAIRDRLRAIYQKQVQ